MMIRTNGLSSLTRTNWFAAFLGLSSLVVLGPNGCDDYGTARIVDSGDIPEEAQVCALYEPYSVWVSKRAVIRFSLLFPRDLIPLVRQAASTWSDLTDFEFYLDEARSIDYIGRPTDQGKFVSRFDGGKFGRDLPFPFDNLAVTLRYPSERDPLEVAFWTPFNTAKPWRANPGPDEWYNAREIALHELGHWLGFIDDNEHTDRLMFKKKTGSVPVLEVSTVEVGCFEAVYNRSKVIGP